MAATLDDIKDSLIKQNTHQLKAAKDERDARLKQLAEDRDNAKKGSQERERMNNELKALRKENKEADKKTFDFSKTTAAEAIALKEKLESQGKIAEHNKEFSKLSYKAQKDNLANQLANAETPAAKKEIKEEQRKLAKEQGSRLDKIGAGISGLWEIGKKGLKTAALGGLAILSTLAVGAFLIMLGKFLQSDSFKKLTTYIKETIIPKFQAFWEFMEDHWGKVLAAITVLTTLLSGLGLIILYGSIKKGYILLKAYTKKHVLKPLQNAVSKVGGKIWEFMKKIPPALVAIKTFFLSTFLPAVTAFMIPLLPIIAIVALISLALYALWNAFEDFCTTLNETGSIAEALKVGVAKFMGTILGFIPWVVLKLVSWVAGLFGFDEFAAKVDAIDPIQWISDTIKCLFDDIQAWFTELFTMDWRSAMTRIIDVAMWLPNIIKDGIFKVTEWFLELFGFGDAAKAVANANNWSFGSLIMGALEPVFCWFEDLFDWGTELAGDFSMMKLLSSAVKKVKQFFWNDDGKSGLLQFDLMNAIPDIDFDLAGMFSGIGDMFSIDGILGGIGRKIEAADFGKWTPDFVKNSLLKVFDPTKGLPKTGKVTKKAVGGTFKAGSAIMVGEMGPELILPSSSGRVMTASQTSQIMQAGLERGSGGMANGGGIVNTTIDARSSSSVTATGNTGQGPLRNNKYTGLNTIAA